MTIDHIKTPTSEPKVETGGQEGAFKSQRAAQEVSLDFTFKDQKVRVVMVEGEPWFVAQDVCVTLFDPARVKGAGVTQYMRHIDTTDRRLVPKNTLSQYQGNQRGSGGVVTLITEAGLYKLVMRSDKPEAKPFQDWVTREVLPTIRKTGTYSVHDMPEPAPASEAPEVITTSVVPPFQRLSSPSVEAAFKLLVQQRKDATVTASPRTEPR